MCSDETENERGKQTRTKGVTVHTMHIKDAAKRMIIFKLINLAINVSTSQLLEIQYIVDSNTIFFSAISFPCARIRAALGVVITILANGKTSIIGSS